MQLLEALYYISGIALAIIAGFGLRQLSELRQSRAVAVQRAALEQAFRLAEFYHTYIQPLEREAYHATKGMPLKGDVDSHARLNWGEYRDDEKARFLAAFSSDSCHMRPVMDLMNKLETVSALVDKGIADDDASRTFFGWTLCDDVSRYAPIMAHWRDFYPGTYAGTVKLYERWWRLRQQSRAAQEGIDQATTIPPAGAG